MTSTLSLPVQYARVSPREHPRRNGAYGGALALAANLVLSTRLFFPRQFDEAVEALLLDAHAATIPADRARWYFRSALQINVDPARLRYRISDYVRDHRGLRWIGLSFLDGADWRAALTPLARSPVHREMTDLVAAGLDFRAIRAYRSFQHAAELGRPPKRNGIRLTSLAEIEGYFRYCVDLIESMREHGVVPRRQFSALRRFGLKHREARPLALDGAERDIGVAINADGELIRHLGGKHRTAVAQALQLPSIPVEVRLVHVGWLAQQMDTTGLPAHQAIVQALGGLSAAHQSA
jgi:hypothetical protein